jgi:hypothetical protein
MRREADSNVLESGLVKETNILYMRTHPISIYSASYPHGSHRTDVVPFHGWPNVINLTRACGLNLEQSYAEPRARR